VILYACFSVGAGGRSSWHAVSSRADRITFFTRSTYHHRKAQKKGRPKAALSLL